MIRDSAGVIWRTAVEVELVELGRLHRYLTRERTLGYVRPLIGAIDDYVEQITGDRTTLHTRTTASDE